MEDDTQQKERELAAAKAEVDSTRKEQQKLAERLCVEEQRKKQNSKATDDLRSGNERPHNLLHEEQMA
jgi:hypothetical protein